MTPKKQFTKLDDDPKTERKKPELSQEEKAKRDQKNWEKCIIAIDHLDKIELDYKDSGIETKSPDYLKEIPNPLFEQMAMINKAIDRFKIII